ncbi:uncharacterized protein LOC127095817 [Lathyrus oleraceus]|uniref:uncharacterized protein LOC127095817 n=1 Tax=Pisum sativum TaxID=3888 RepID=UPI0021D0EE73|nr:uncharacterized protein LOC127095817 [Pisum sativum]
MVNRNQNADNVIRQIRHDDMAANNNLAAMVKRIMIRNGVNFGLRRPNYTSPLLEYIIQPETPTRTKIPKFTKFSRDTTKSTIKHVARYLIEAGDILNNESLRIKYNIPSPLTNNAFTWFTTLPQSLIHTWNQLERMFHEQFYMGQTKINLKELASIKRKFTKPIDDYLNSDLVQNDIQEGRLKFGDKPRSQIKIDSNPLQMADARYMEPEGVTMVEVTDDFDMTEVIEDFVNEPIMVRVYEHLDQEFFNDFIQEAVGNATNESTDVFDTESLKIPT